MAIVESLRKADVFTKAIAASKTKITKDKFLSSIESSNSTRSISSRKIGISHATSRRVLEFLESPLLTEAAVPPLSPPSIGEQQMALIHIISSHDL
ncbi:unnamed protein product [Rhodiola kirilowii]